MPRRKKTIKSFSDEFEDFDDFNVQTQPQRNAANARERARMRVLSKAFCRLKTTLPWVPADTKLSKLDTLRLATSYIAHLRTILVNSSSNCDDGVKDEPAAVVHPKNLSWPFSNQQQQKPTTITQQLITYHTNNNNDDLYCSSVELNENYHETTACCHYYHHQTSLSVQHNQQPYQSQQQYYY